MELVIDKSYLQGASTQIVRSLCEEHSVLFTETLLYEILTSDSHTRDKCFAKLPATDNPVVLIPRMGPLIRYEIERHTAASPILDHRLALSYRFNPRLRDRTFRHSEHEEATLRQWKLDIGKEVLRFNDLAISISDWCPDLKRVSGEELKAACQDLKEQASHDLNVTRRIYRDISPAGYPHERLLGPSWALFRWVQIRVLFALDHIERYKFADLANVPGRIEHDIHDVEYAAIGALSGALATRDKDIAKNFMLCCPDGNLVM